MALVVDGVGAVVAVVVVFGMVVTVVEEDAEVVVVLAGGVLVPHADAVNANMQRTTAGEASFFICDTSATITHAPRTISLLLIRMLETYDPMGPG